MVVCPGYTVSEIFPVDQQELVPLFYKDEWMDDFFNERGRHEPGQK
jgi:hypothetical protein